MTPLTTALLAWLMLQPRHVTDRDEGTDARRLRLATVAAVIVEAAEGDPYRAAYLAAQGKHETNFARYVGEGRCSDGPVGSRCDNGWARTYWQNWQVACPVAWLMPEGSLEEMRAAARCTVRLMLSGQRRCRLNGYDPLHGAFAGSRGGAACTGDWAVKRSRTFHRALTQIQVANRVLR